MMTVHEVSELTGVSIRALHHYDRIGLLHPAEVTGAGYRLYDDTALERLQCILLFKELQFSLKEIKDILDSPDFDYSRALDQQITLLQMKKEHLENLINLAREIKQIGVKKLDFTVFNTKKMDEYAKRAKESWGQTPEYREFEEKSKDRAKEDERKLWAGLMEIFTEFGSMKGSSPSGSAAQRLVKKLQDYITEHFYTCSDEILAALGNMYAGGGEMTDNINHAGGEGTAEFAAQAIKVYCSIP
ncbi:MerR family transcriptional regulator [Hominisplanchenecus murintestinalis]|uniref:MerR family transcriptional regulator n=1 Tax=Hominisplanchenecus murintestinalis TaxID=2941517 RepID=A0AC61QUV1_9FIRM|nr:MerR family transcriptional regulator [Hominisplanchenecus murintestinalis]TGX96169.1 MerR family transcriptional regulator [Hominisplanchenecus murintestinalis]